VTFSVSRWSRRIFGVGSNKDWGWSLPQTPPNQHLLQQFMQWFFTSLRLGPPSLSLRWWKYISVQMTIRLTTRTTRSFYFQYTYQSICSDGQSHQYNDYNCDSVLLSRRGLSYICGKMPKFTFHFFCALAVPQGKSWFWMG
jgi:hypothetical protein